MKIFLVFDRNGLQWHLVVSCNVGKTIRPLPNGPTKLVSIVGGQPILASLSSPFPLKNDEDTVAPALVSVAGGTQSGCS